MTDSLKRGAVAALFLLALSPAAAQEVAPPPTPNADALATQMRILGSNPRSVPALLTAADLSVRLGDAPAALAFLARAQAVEPSNPRINAGRASAMVLLERPGEALRLFDVAARAGVAMDPYLLQRGLAYDLTGQPSHAQRDYRRLLQIGSDDEVVRRLALSLGISGQRDEAMALLDPLLRRSDRAAWRARACIMAMSGDVAGAQKIAGSMIPGGAALAPFFARLQALAPADRAFAVHFGAVAPSLARANDARLAPQVAALPTRAPQPPAAAPVAVASNPNPVAPERLSRRERQRAEREERRAARNAVQVATRGPGTAAPPSRGTRTPITPPSSPPRGAPIAGTPVTVAAAPRQAAPVGTGVPQGTAAPIAGTPVTVAAAPRQTAPVITGVPQGTAAPATSAPAASGMATPAPVPTQVAAATPTPITSAPITGVVVPQQNSAGAVPVVTFTPSPAVDRPVQLAAAPVTTTPPSSPSSGQPLPSGGTVAGAASVTRVPVSGGALSTQGVTAPPSTPAQVAAIAPSTVFDRPAQPAPGPVSGPTAASGATARWSPVQAAAAPTTVPGAGGGSTSTPLASAVSAASTLSGTSLPRAAVPWAVTPDTPPATATATGLPVASGLAPAPVATPPTPVAATPVRTAAVARRNTDLLASIVAGISVPASELDVAPPATTRAAPVRTPGRVAAVPDTPVRTAEAKKPDAKRPEPKKPEPKKPEPAKAEPARWFVQVAGGARAADLVKDWRRLAAKSPAAFKGKAAWTTPLRATNRLLAGPFASQGAAMSFVNQLAKDGSSAFAWRSEAGQKIEKLATP